MSLYATGTITGALNATTISGTGTKWSDAKFGITNGSVLFASSNAGVDGVYQVKRVISDTSIELVQPIYKAFTNSKYSILVAESASTAAWANQLAATLGYYQAQMDGWQQIMTGTGDVALTAPDGTKVTIKSFTKLANDIDKKADGNDLRFDTIDKKTGGRVTSPLDVDGSVHVITQSSSFGAYGFKYPSTLLQMAYWFCENFGDLVFVTTAATKPGTEKYFSMRQNGDFNTQGNISCVSLIQTCDRDAKDNIEPIENPLEKLDKVNGYTYLFKDSGLPSAGIIAQEFKEILPDIISTKSPLIPKYNDEGEAEGVEPDSDLNNLTYGVEPMGVIGFLVAALKAEKLEREKLGMALADLKGKVELLLSKE
ncbi:tail fiber domain-containing protein [Hafnia alvei]|uniref:tail fiber domain-containing protein n=1 Tax=Hafnia alvei TaxID=569 RepID=UPI004044DAFA